MTSRLLFLLNSSHFDEMLSESWEVLQPRIAGETIRGFFGSKVDDDFHGKRGKFMHIEAVEFEDTSKTC